MHQVIYEGKFWKDSATIFLSTSNVQEHIETICGAPYLQLLFVQKLVGGGQVVPRAVWSVPKESIIVSLVKITYSVPTTIFSSSSNVQKARENICGAPDLQLLFL